MRTDSMIDAASAGDIERVRMLITVYGARINQGHTKHNSARSGAERRVRMVGRGGKRWTGRDVCVQFAGRTALITAAENGHAEVCGELLKFGADINLVDEVRAPRAICV